MIAGWLVKLVLGIALFGFAALELGSPVIVRIQLDGVAHDAADDAAFIIRDRGNPEAAQQAAADRAAKDSAEITAFAVDQQGRVRLTVRKQATSYLLKEWDRTKSWYDVTVSATSEEKR
ncbi:MAG TPA: hypothetical protein VM938_13065 [Acidimicrobiales bacterium]|nr:hypothetical protein [Acidimicrobiales bacterium]